MTALAASGCRSSPSASPPAASPQQQAPAAQPPTQPPHPQVRLDGTARPTGYEAELTILPDSDTFTGVIDIDLALKDPAALIWMHGSGLKIKAARLRTADGEVAARPTPQEDGFLGFALAQSVPAGQARLHVEYQGPLSARDNDGLFRQKDGALWYAFSDFEPTDARRAFPCFDEPGYKVPWQLTLHVRKEHVAVANTPVESETDEPGGMKRVRFRRTRPLPSYLVALAVGPFEVVDAGQARQSHAPLRIITPRGRAAEARYAAEVSAEILSRLEDYFGIPYPYEKLDQITVPEFHGAMENPGLITYTQSLLIAAAKDDNILRRRSVAETAAHEMAHLWFGDLVTMKFWDDIWLNESFASWMGTRIIDQWQPSWDMPVDRIHVRAGAIRRDSLRSARRIRQPIESEHDIRSAFDSITYNKGQAVLEMFENWLGADRFRAGVRRYLQAHAYGNADAADFLAALSEADPALGPAMRTFLDQPGVPLVSAELSCGPAGTPPRLLLTQSRYLQVGAAGAQAEDAPQWQIPICARYGSGGDKDGRACTLLKERQGALQLGEGGCPAWVLPNQNGTGYYRVRYQGDLLSRLLRDGGRALSVAERVSVLEDIGALMRSGDLPAADVLGVLPALSGDRSRHILDESIGILGGLRRHLVPAELLPNYARLLRKLYGARARALGVAPRPDEAEDTRLLRPTLLSAVAGPGEDQQLRVEARRRAQAWLDDRSAADPDIVGTVLILSARFGDQALFQRMHEQAAREAERRHRQRILGALGCFQDPAIYQQALGLILSGEFDIRESEAILYGASYGDRTAEMAYQFVKDHFDELLAKLPQTEGAHLITIGGFCDEGHKADLAAFYRDRAARLPGGPRLLRQTLEGIGVCVAMKGRQQQSVAGFLKKY